MIRSSTDIPVNTKQQTWEDKKSQCKWDLAVKVAKAAAATFLLITLATSALALPILSYATDSTLSFIATTISSLIALITVTKIYYSFIVKLDFTDYSKEENAKKAIKLVQKTDTTPLPLDFYKRLHRYGILSDSEFNARKNLKTDISTYKANICTLYCDRKEIVRLQKKYEERNLTQTDHKRNEELKNNIKFLIKENKALMEKFNKLANNICSFDSR